MATITTTGTSAASLAPLQMHLSTNPPADQTQGALSDPDALGFALLAAEERLQEGDDRMLKTVLDLVFNMGRKAGKLEDENARLQSEISLQQRHIETLGTVHREKWTAHLEATRVRMHTISGEISIIIQSIGTFQAQYPNIYEPHDPKFLSSLDARRKMSKSLGSDVFCRTARTLSCQATHLPYFQEWLEMTLKPINSLEKHPKYSIPTQIVEAVATPQALIPAESFPQMARFVQNRLALEREIASRKQELTAFEQLQKSKEQEFENRIGKWNVTFREGTFTPCLEFASELQRKLDSYIARESQKNEKIRSGRQEPITDPKNAGIEEANRLKRMISAIVPQIQEAVEWTKRGIEQ